MTPRRPVDPRAWRARIGVSLLFLVNGALVANVLPRLPAIKAGLDLSNAELGAAIAAMPIGGLLAGGVRGRAHPSLRQRPPRRRDRDRLRAAPGPRRPRAVVARAGGLVPRPRRARRDDGRRGERPWDRGPAALRAVDPALVPRLVERRHDARWRDGRRRRGCSPSRCPSTSRSPAWASRSSRWPRSSCSSPTPRPTLEPATQPGRTGPPAERAAAAAAAGPDRAARPAGRHARGRRADLEHRLPRGRPRPRRRHRGRRVRAVHGRDDHRPADQRPLGRPLGRRPDRPLGRGRRGHRPRARGAGRPDGRRMDRVRRVHRRRRRRVVDVPADGRRRRLAAGHPIGARGRDRVLAGARRVRHRADADGPRRRRVRPVGRVPDPAVGGPAGGRPRARPCSPARPRRRTASSSSRPATDGVVRRRSPRGPRPPRPGRRRGARRAPCPPTSRRPSPRR